MASELEVVSEHQILKNFLATMYCT